jgi:hypothetical protein
VCNGKAQRRRNSAVATQTFQRINYRLWGGVGLASGAFKAGYRGIEAGGSGSRMTCACFPTRPKAQYPRRRRQGRRTNALHIFCDVNCGVRGLTKQENAPQCSRCEAGLNAWYPWSLCIVLPLLAILVLRFDAVEVNGSRSWR